MQTTATLRVQAIRSAVRTGRQFAATRPLPSYLLAQTPSEAAATVQRWQGRRQAAMVAAMSATTEELADALGLVEATSAEVDVAYRVAAYIR